MIETNEGMIPIVDNILRAIGSGIDRVAYLLLELAYRLFFEIGTADIISGDVVSKFFGRIQLIFGVFMLFQLALTIIKGIVNPDGFTDGKSGGAMNVIVRIITALLILTLLVPINFTGSNNEYEKQISNNGILFGSLYSLQKRVLTNNVIGKVIFGNERGGTSSSDVKQSARIFSTTIIKGFYRINLKPENQRTHQDGKEDYMIRSNRMCQNYDYSKYLKSDVGQGDIISMIDDTCGVVNVNYAIAYTPFLSFIIGFVFAGFMISFAFDIVVRAAKLAILRLISPISIIGYMDPGGSKDNAFNSWVKTLTATYIDLFVRLATVYFVLYMIEVMLTNNPFSTGDSSISFLAKIVVYIGLLIFAKQAPKFVRDVLGLKGDTGSLFGGLTEAVGIGGAGLAATLGLAGSTATGYRAAREENAALHPNSRFNILRNVGSAALGAIGGGITGVAAATRKDANFNTVSQALAANNARRAGHSTLLGRVRSDLTGLATGQGLAAKSKMEYENNKTAASKLLDYKKALEDEGTKDHISDNIFGTYRDASLGDIHVDLKSFLAARDRAAGAGLATFEYNDGVNSYTGLNVAYYLNENVINDIKSSQAEAYSDMLMRRMDAASRPGAAQSDIDWVNKQGTAVNAFKEANKAANEANIRFNGHYSASTTDASGNTYKGTKAALGEAKTNVTNFQTDMRHIMDMADDSASGKK